LAGALALAAAYLRTQLEQWGKIIHEIGLQPE
jgi:hypothetical protein